MRNQTYLKLLHALLQGLHDLIACSHHLDCTPIARPSLSRGPPPACGGALLGMAHGWRTACSFPDLFRGPGLLSFLRISIPHLHLASTMFICEELCLVSSGTEAKAKTSSTQSQSQAHTCALHYDCWKHYQESTESYGSWHDQCTSVRNSFWVCQGQQRDLRLLLLAKFLAKTACLSAASSHARATCMVGGCSNICRAARVAYYRLSLNLSIHFASDMGEVQNFTMIKSMVCCRLSNSQNSCEVSRFSPSTRASPLRL